MISALLVLSVLINMKCGWLLSGLLSFARACLQFSGLHAVEFCSNDRYFVCLSVTMNAKHGWPVWTFAICTRVSTTQAYTQFTFLKNDFGHRSDDPEALLASMTSAAPSYIQMLTGCSSSKQVFACIFFQIQRYKNHSCSA